MSDRKDWWYACDLNKDWIPTPELILEPIAEIETQKETKSDEVAIVENIVPDPEMVEMTDSDSDTNVEADQASIKVQDLENKVSSLERLWEIEKLLNIQLRQALLETMEEQDKLKIQIDQMGAPSNTPCAAPRDKGKRKIEDCDLEEPSKKKRKMICYNCGREGHTSPYCPYLEPGSCFICGRKGHQAKRCPRKCFRLC